VLGDVLPGVALAIAGTGALGPALEGVASVAREVTGIINSPLGQGLIAQARGGSFREGFRRGLRNALGDAIARLPGFIAGVQGSIREAYSTRIAVDDEREVAEGLGSKAATLALGDVSKTFERSIVGQFLKVKLLGYKIFKFTFRVPRAALEGEDFVDGVADAVATGGGTGAFVSVFAVRTGIDALNLLYQTNRCLADGGSCTRFLPTPVRDGEQRRLEPRFGSSRETIVDEDATGIRRLRDCASSSGGCGSFRGGR
jgi:hypothetical protein